MRSPIRVLVLEGSLNSSLAVVRSLGKAGAHITVGDHHRIAPAFLSRYTKRRIFYPSPEENLKEFMIFLEAHLKKESYDLIFAMSDFTILPIAKCREKLASYNKFAISPMEQLMLVHDKADTIMPKSLVILRVYCCYVYRMPEKE